MDYFDWVLTQIKIGETLYTTHTPIHYIYMGVGKSRGQKAIVYSIKKNRKRVSRTFLNGVHKQYLSTDIIPTADWCNDKFPDEMNDGYCNYCVLTSILSKHKQPNP